MPRPKSDTVEFFPHTTAHGKTLFVLEERFGNTGYAFWFKLLELLGTTEGHYIDTHDEDLWMYLCARAKVDETKAYEILDQLARLQAIDQELWKTHVIWCQNFVDGISHVYTESRKRVPPKRPERFLTENTEKRPRDGGFLTENVTEDPSEEGFLTENDGKQGGARDNHHSLSLERVERVERVYSEVGFPAENEEPAEEPEPSREDVYLDKYPKDFESFVAAYPKHVEKAKAFRPWQYLIDTLVDPKTIVKTAQAYAHECKVEEREPKFISAAQNFLRDKWRSYLEYKPRASPDQDVNGAKVRRRKCPECGSVNTTTSSICPKCRYEGDQWEVVA